MAINHIDKAIYSLIYNDSTIDGIVKEIDDSNKAIYMYHSENFEYPCVVLESSQDPEDLTMDGVVNNFKSTFEIICLAQTFGEVISLSKAVKSLLREYSDTVGTIEIVRVHFVNEYNIPNLDPVESRTLYGKNLTTDVYFKET